MKAFSFWIALALACGGEVDNRYNGAAIGQPCSPAIEEDATFDGFDDNEVSIELPSPTADPSVLVCLIDHFRGRTDCPYGGANCESKTGALISGEVSPQCVDRRAKTTVTWSCRCANAAGRTDDGANYCSCDSSLTCTQVIAPVAAPEADDQSGAYCIPPGSAFDSSTSCKSSCDAESNPC